MTPRSLLRLRFWRLARLERLHASLAALGLLLFPLALLTGTTLSLLFLEQLSATDSTVQIRFSAVDGDGVEDAQNAERLTSQLSQDRESFSTRLAERPFWFRFSTQGLDSLTTVLELPSRHAQVLACWRVSNLRETLAFATRESVTGAIRPSKAGFVIPLAAAGNDEMLCRITFVGPASFSIVAWDGAALLDSELRWSRAAAFLDGSLITLALFVALIALLNKEWTFVLFSAWLITNLRVAAISGGWDAQWLSYEIPYNWLFLSRKLTFSLFFFLTASLFCNLFRADLSRLRARFFVRVLMWVSAGLLVAAFVLPYRSFLPALWAMAVVTLIPAAVLLIRILRTTRSQVATWYLLSWAYTLAAIVNEILAAALDLRFSSGVLNNVSGAIVSSLLAALALAERLRSERQQKLLAERRAVGVLRRFQDTYNGMPVGLFTADVSGRLVQFNPAFGRMMGLPESTGERQALCFRSLIGKQQFEELVHLSESQTTAEIQSATEPEGRAKWFFVQASRKGNLIEGFIKDITDRKAAELRLRHLANHDPLTELLNRRGLERELESTFVDLRHGATACLAYLDLDRFKLVNDLFGHMAGDHVLRQIADRLQASLEAPHVLARVGGDEFVAILRGRTPAQARALCETVLRSINDAPLQFLDKAFSVTGCIGVIGLDASISTHDALTACDRACSDAKSLGGSRVVVYDEHGGQLRRHLEEIHFAASFKHQLPVDRFFVQMQPIVSLRSAFASLNYEVLLRMRGADGKSIPPDKFIGAAERNGVMANVDRWVLAHVLEWLDAHPAHLDRLGFASVNLSGASLNDERFVDDSVALIRAHPRAAARVCFEITESVALYDLNNTRRFVDRVKSFGSRVALDDFGAGYTSFNYLKDLPADIVKIDGAFIKGLGSHPANRAITRAIVDLSHQMGMSVIAEWTETRDVIETLIRMGVDFGQGYGLARPLDPEVLASATSGGILVPDAPVVALLQQWVEPQPAAPRHVAGLI